MGQLPKSCKAAVLVEYNQPFAIREVGLPEVEDGGILVKVRMAGICGTDVHQHEGKLGMRLPLPNLMGHETLGEIVKLGKGRTRDVAGEPLAVGDRIFWAHASCGECYYCKIVRKPFMCEKLTVYGHYPPELLRGGFAEYA